MLPTRLPVRALVAVAAVTGLALTGLPPAPAHALAPITEGAINLVGHTAFKSPDCAAATPLPDDVQAPFTAGTTVKRTLTFNQTATAVADVDDKVVFKGSQTLAVASTGTSQLTSLTATSTVTGSVTKTKAVSACTPDTNPLAETSQADVEATLNRTTAGWLRIQISSVGTGGQFASGDLGGGPQGLAQVTFGSFSLRDISTDQWVYVPAGDYALSLALGGASALDHGIPSVSLKQTVKLTFAPAGVAKAATTGTARAKVIFPNVLTCATGRATVRLTSKITGASRASLYVNGVRKTTIVRPKARTVTLTGVPKSRAVSLKLVVVDRGRTLTATRSYRSC